MRKLIDKLTTKRLIILSVIIFVIVGLCYMPTFAADAFVGTHSAGTSKTFTITDAGMYRFNLAGSKGGNYGSYTGGKGGAVSFQTILNVGDTVQVVVGNTSGIGGGGTGKTSNGGGATYIKVNDNIIGVAGGGGGATTAQNGLPGGASGSGNNGTVLAGSSSTDSGTAGGGGGYRGGTFGEYHAHTGNSTSGGGCYTKGVCGRSIDYDTDPDGDGGYTQDHDKWQCTGHHHSDGDWISAHYFTYDPGSYCPGSTCCPTLYEINCGKSEVDTQAYGGSNYIASSCTSIYNFGNFRNSAGTAYISKVSHITYDLNKPVGAKYEPEIEELSYSTSYLSTTETISYLPVASLYGYMFDGWYTSATGGTHVNVGDILPSISNEITLYAHWSRKVINIELNYNGPEIANKTIIRNYGDVWNLETPEYLGYKFLGWYTDITGGTLINNSAKVEVNEDTVLYAHWQTPTYTLMFNSNGGSAPSFASKSVTNLSPVGNLPTTSRNGFEFLGWYTSVNEENAELITTETIAKFTGNTTLYTHWQLKTGYDFPYTGEAQYFVAPKDGYYKLEVWRAQGGNYGKYKGGLGGYSKEVVWLNEGDVLQVNVGGQGSTFNGGGVGAISIGGGGGYYGGTIGHYHVHTGNKDSGGGCYTIKRTGTKTVEEPCGGHVGPSASCDQPGCGGVDSSCDRCGDGYHGSHSRSCWHSTTKTVSYTYYDLGCGEEDEKVQARGGSNYTAVTVNNTDVLAPEKKAGVRIGNGYAKVTQMYAMLLDTSIPTTDNNYEVNATNLAFIDTVDTLIDEENLPFTTPNFNEFKDKQTGIEGQSAFGLMLVERNKEYGFNEKLPVPSLKGWKFVGWYTEPQINKGQLKTDGSLVEIKDSNTVLKNPVLYAHWQEETYYIKYYKANTDLNNYNNKITNPEAVFDTTLASKSETKLFRYDATEDCYIQTVKYDHDISVLPNYYAKTGYYFKNWTNQADTNLAGTVGIGTGTGKQTGETYYESEVLKPNKSGEQFLETIGNFNYITNEKEIALDSTVKPVWSYGSDTVVMYATWEPIKYQLRFNGTNNWNTTQGSYLQNVVDSTGKQSTTIRYDQIFTLNVNKFTRKAPYTITSPDGLPVTLKTGYSWIGWGFGKPTMKYSTPAWNLIAVNTEYDPDQALVDLDGITGRDYINQQASVKNVISSDGIKAIEKYISDWSNARTDSNRADKTELDMKVIESNLHSIWRRNIEGDEPIDPDTPPVTPPGDDPDDDNFGITITFDLNGGEWLDTKTNKPTTEPIVLKQELFNEYYYEFDIIGNTNTDLLNKSVTFDAYGKKSNINPLQNYDNATGLNYTFRKSDEHGNKYRFCGWSLEKGQISADYNATIDGITKNNFDTYDATNNNNTIKIANDLTLYAIWEPELTLNVHLYRILGESADTSGSLTKANQNIIKAEGLPKVTIKPGEEGRYLITLNALTQGTVPVTNDDGESVYLYRPIDINVEFDSAMTGIYNATVNSAIQDRLNIITTSDGTEPTLATSNLNRNMVGIKSSSLSRNFHVPLYLGTTTAANYGYPSFKVDGYDLNITASRYSNFHKGIETVTAEFIIETTKSCSGGGEEPDPGPGPEPGPTPGPIDPTPPTNTLDELRTKLKIKLR